MALHVARIRDRELVDAIAGAPPGEARDLLLGELGLRTRLKALRLLPDATGRCAAGRPIYMGRRGEYAGQVLHQRADTLCEHCPWEWDPPDVRTERLLALVDELAS